MKSRVDLWSALAYIAGGGLASTAVAFATVAPHYQVQILAFSAIVVGVAGLLIRLFKNPTPTVTTLVPTSSGGTVELKTVSKETP